MIELYDMTLSGNCYKVRLLLSLLRVDFQIKTVNGAIREQKTPAFLALNPLGQVPVLKQGDLVLRDSQAILVYLARTYGADHWFPVNDAVALAEVVAWLSIAANEIARGPHSLRMHYLFGRTINIEEAMHITTTVIEAIEQQLTSNEWLVGAQMTIADIAMYPYIALAHEGRFNLAPYVHIQQWLARIEALPGYVAMPGISLPRP